MMFTVCSAAPVWDMNLLDKVSVIHVGLLHCTQYKPVQLYLSCLSCADSSHKLCCRPQSYYEYT